MNSYIDGRILFFFFSLMINYIFKLILYESNKKKPYMIDELKFD
jgi:hypothetical protein